MADGSAERIRFFLAKRNVSVYCSLRRKRRAVQGESLSAPRSLQQQPAHIASQGSEGIAMKATETQMKVVVRTALRHSQSHTLKTREQELQEAVERVYRKYGSDLSSFRRDVEREMTKSAGSTSTEISKRD